MKSHRRDQSDSHMPLRSSEHHQPASDLHEVRLTIDDNQQPPPPPPLLPTLTSEASSLEPMTGNGVLAQRILSSTSHPGDGGDGGGGNGQSSTESMTQTTRSNNERRNTKRFRMELVKTAVAFYFLMIGAFLNFFLLTVIHDIVPWNTKPLPDLVFSLIDQQRWAWAVGDVLSTFNAIVGFTIVLLHRQRIVVLRRVFLIGAIMYGLRAVILSVTFLPPSFNNREEICLPQSNRTGSGMYATEIATRFVTYVVTLGLTSGQEKILCGDLMFSGHTVVLTIMYFTQLQYTPRGLVFLRYIATPITFLGIAALVVSGGHYTMDVLVAYWLTSHVFWGYHQMFELPRNERAQAPMSRLWWFWLCYWFENDVPHGKMRNEWNWPFSRPQFLHTAMETINAKLQ